MEFHEIFDAPLDLVSEEITQQSPHAIAIDTTSLSQLSEQLPNDIFRNGVDEGKCIAGTFKMVFPSNDKKKETIVTIKSENVLHSFRVFFKLNVADLKKLEDISPRDDFRLSLQGAEVERLSQIPKISTLPIQLVFSKGLHLEWTHRNQIKILNTWPIIGKADAGHDAWFVSQDNNGANREQTTKRKHDGTEESHENEALRASKQRERKQTKRLRKEVSTNHRAKISTSSDTDFSVLKSDRDGIMASTSSTSTCAVPKLTSNTNNSALSQSKGMSSTKAGFSSGWEKCAALSDIRLGRSPLLVGVVREISAIKETSSKDWMRFVQIVDPSNCHGFGLKINCFTKKHQEWLPHAEVGDVILLRDVQIVNFQGNLSGTGYHGRLRWATFSPMKGQVHHGPPNQAPKEAAVGSKNGDGVIFTPFYQPRTAEIQYCVNLSDWWRDFINDSSNGDVHLGTARPKTAQFAYSRPVQRVHRLISEAGPSVPPNGYFDCTVEVIKGFNNSNVYTLYVTDYTRNAQTATVSYKWCPQVLSELVLPLEMWDAAADIAPSMRPGHFYFIENARMKGNPAGYLEGKVVQNKITQLSKQDTNNIHLRALLERKRLWEDETAKSESGMVYSLIEDIEEKKFFNCTVELLHIDKTAGRKPCLYVTDYTSHSMLVTSANEPWSFGLDGRILKIFLAEEQEGAASVIEEGSFYCIKNLRLRDNRVEGCFCVVLGGADKHIVPLNANKTDNEHLNGLLRRRERWYKRQQENNIGANEIPLPTSFPKITSAVAPAHPSMCIKNIAIDSTRHRIIARVVDFYPLDLKDAFFQQCARCNLDIPKTQRACTKCGDFDHEYIQYFYQLYIMVEDEHNEQIIISIDDKCLLLTGLKRACMKEDSADLTQFLQQVKTLLGNLPMMHSGLKSNKHIEIDTPLLCFDIESWSIPGGYKAFRLDKYTSANF